MLYFNSTNGFNKISIYHQLFMNYFKAGFNTAGAHGE